MEELYARTQLLLGDEGVERLKNAKVLVFGLGGVGGCAVEALARAGVGHLTLVDHDRVSATNLNRQILALTSTVGKYKTEVARERISLINPHCQVLEKRIFYLPENTDTVFSDYDYVLDAIDTMSGKIAIIERCKQAGVPVVSCMGTGNKLYPERMILTDLYATNTCPLARVMRRELKKRGIEKLTVVCSDEQPLTPLSCVQEEGKRQTPGTVSFLPPVAGFLMAGKCIRDILAIRE